MSLDIIPLLVEISYHLSRKSTMESSESTVERSETRSALPSLVERFETVPDFRKIGRASCRERVCQYV